jgi:hypothetical protein
VHHHAWLESSFNFSIHASSVFYSLVVFRVSYGGGRFP